MDEQWRFMIGAALKSYDDGVLMNGSRLYTIMDEQWRSGHDGTGCDCTSMYIITN